MSTSQNISDSEWEEIILRLHAFTRSLTGKKKWFRGKNATSFVMGKEVKDYVSEAITRYLEDPGKYDPAKGELIDYLKLHLIRSMVANDVRKEENKQTDNIFGYSSSDGSDENEDRGNYLDRILPYTEELFDDAVDYESVKAYIEKEAAGDEIVESIFIGIYSYGLPRRDIIEEFQMSAKEFDNGMRRFNTILARAISFFNTDKQTA